MRLYELYKRCDDSLIAKGTAQEIATKINRSVHQVYVMAQGRHKTYYGKIVGRKEKENISVYAIYKGDNFIDVGSPRELSERLGVKTVTIRNWYSKRDDYQRGKNRTYAIKVDN